MTALGESVDPQERIAYDGPLDDVVAELCEAYRLGHPSSFHTIALGYEDCNLDVSTDQGRYVAKMFAKTRSPEEIDRHVNTMEHAIAAGVRHPRLHATSETGSLFGTKGISMVVMDHVHGDSFYGMHREPTDAELRDVARQASLINAMDYHPPLLFDSWAIPNFVKLYELVEEFIPTEDRPLIDLALARYEEITVEQLPHAFVHGDFTKLNLMTDQRGDVNVLDFSVSNWYPRIQEQAVIAASLLHSNKYPTSLAERCQRIGDAYSALLH